jgi:N6-L-threonylcarbamoyladenine synthase
VVPELASRAHLETIGPVVDRALAEAGVALGDINGIAVTQGPGLLGALLVGVTWGRTLAWREGLPLVGVHHLEGHLFAPVLEDPTVEPPFTALLVSGGHTMLLDVPAWGEYRLLGATRDDAAGEAFDKVGTLLGLDYPAGAAIERLAAEGDPDRYRFPRPLLRGVADDDRFNFSFSGLKTAVLHHVRREGLQPVTDPDQAPRPVLDLLASFQRAVVVALLQRFRAEAERARPASLLLTGGVAANSVLRREAARMAERLGLPLFVPPILLSTDNAAMIAAAGQVAFDRGVRAGWDLNAEPHLPLA